MDNENELLVAIARVENDIIIVNEQIRRVEAAIAEAKDKVLAEEKLNFWEPELQQLRRKEEQLREEKNQLREEKNQLRRKEEQLRRKEEQLREFQASAALGKSSCPIIVFLYKVYFKIA